MRTVEGVFVDPFERVTKIVKVGKDIREIQKLLNVELLEVFNPSRVGGPDIELWMDAMGQLRENPGWWFGSWHQLLAGRCFICRLGLKSFQKSHGYDLAGWIRPGMKESVAQIQYLNRARVLSNPDEVRKWHSDRRHSEVLTQMLALAVEPAALLP